MYIKKKKEVYYKDEYGTQKFKKIHQLTKPRSPLCIEFMTDDLPDEWLIDIVEYRKKSGLVTEHFVIRQIDIQQWLKNYYKEGFLLTED